MPENSLAPLFACVVVCIHMRRCLQWCATVRTVCAVVCWLAARTLSPPHPLLHVRAMARRACRQERKRARPLSTSRSRYDGTADPARTAGAVPPRSDPRVPMAPAAGAANRPRGRAWRPVCADHGRGGTCDPRAPELDHIVPLALGGAHVPENVQDACRACNSAKGATDRGQIWLPGLGLGRGPRIPGTRRPETARVPPCEKRRKMKSGLLKK